MVVRMADLPRTELTWAARVADEQLAPLDERWRHTLTVVDQARGFRGVLPDGELETLEAAAYLHDVGYAPTLVRTGFHPLDGARFVRAAGHERLAALIAYHAAAREEAEELGLADELGAFVEEDSLLARALTYCDMTTGPDGSRMELTERLGELAARRGDDDPAVRAVCRAASRLAAVVREVESVLEQAQSGAT